MAAKGTIEIDENLCKGCGYCATFCARGCVTISEDRFTKLGYELPIFFEPDKCNACGICSWMCPEYAIEVYKYAAVER